MECDGCIPPYVNARVLVELREGAVPLLRKLRLRAVRRLHEGGLGQPGTSSLPGWTGGARLAAGPPGAGVGRAA